MAFLVYASGFKGFERFLAVLRGLAQETKRLVLVVTSVNADINRIPRWEIGTRRDNPMWQGFVECFIPLLSPDETDDMVTSLGVMMGLKYTSEALTHLYHLTAGHPFLTR